MTAKRPTRRINRGRNHEYVLDGVKCDGVTSLLNGGMPKPALTAWAAKAVAQLVCERRDILTQLSDEEIIDLLKGAPFRERDAAANRGSEVHRLAEKYARGEKVEVPDALVGHVDAYIAWRDAWHPTNEIIEATVINRQYRYMGTLDAIADLPGLGTTLYDVKTNRSGPFGEVALQLCAYGRAEAYIGDDGVERAMPHIDSYAVLWLTGEGGEFYPYEVTDREWRQFLYCAETTRWVNERAQAVKGYAMRAPVPQEAHA